MELVYLWVEDYKNIKQQGFNFSPKFECSYKDGILNICDKKKKECKNNDYIENFFEDKINVTAIVGENGSGKSGILECIEKIILSVGTLKLDNFKYILVYYDEQPLYVSNIEIDTSIDKETFSDICSLVYKYYVSDDETHQARYFSSANLQYLTLDKQGIVNILSAKQNSMNSFQISSFMYEPVKIEITLKSYDELVQEHGKFLDFKKSDEIEKILKAIIDPYHRYLSIIYIRQEGLHVVSEILQDKESLKQNVDSHLSIDDFSRFFISVATTKEYKLSNISQEQKDIYFHKDYWHYFEFDFIDEKERRYNHLSHGEKVIFSQLLSIFFYINANEKLLFLFDEPEIALHPNWQKQYLNEVISLLQKIPKKYHFIFTSHSPFLLSDLPKDNVIFLEKDKDGNCKNARKEVNINPFGANIHTLLSHGFFMKDGLMGEFAKEKIQNVINFINDKESNLKKEEIYPIIELIGEPFLKQKLKEQYFMKYPQERDIDVEIDILEKKLTELKHAKNSK